MMIKRPDNPEYLTLLTQKREEYQKRIKANERMVPEQWPLMDAVLKYLVASEVLANDQVDTLALGQKLKAGLGSGFDDRVFANACRVIEDYCQTGGQRNIRLFVPHN